MPLASDDSKLPAVRREARTIVVVDLADSVRLIERHEDDTVAQWRAFVSRVEARLPAHGGRLVKSLGDGLLLEFEALNPGLECAFAMHRDIEVDNDPRADDRRLALRVGVHVADVIVDRHDIYGSGVNLASRLATLAAPGQTVVSSPVRDRLVPGLDAEVEDLGECYLRNVSQPVRAWRVRPAAFERSTRPEEVATAHGGPVIAVVPFGAWAPMPEARFLGEVLADEVIAGLSKSPQLRVISRLSSAPFADRQPTLADLRTLLGASYVVSGRLHLDTQRRVMVSVELADARDGRVLWAARLRNHADDLLAADSELVNEMLSAVAHGVFEREVELTHTRLPCTLETHSLLLSAIASMHRATRRDYEHAGRLLAHLQEREPRHPEVHAWSAKWHLLRIVQGWTAERDDAGARALASVRRALDLDPDSTLALAIDGLVHAYLFKDLARAERSYRRAVAVNPSESLAWLFSSTLHAYRGEGQPAIEASESALRLSPLDPLKYFYDSLASTAALAAHDWARSIALGQRSLLHNRLHASTWRTLVYAYVMADRPDDARAAARELLVVEPELTVARFRDRFPGRDGPMAEPWARALSEAGIPA